MQQTALYAILIGVAALFFLPFLCIAPFVYVCMMISLFAMERLQKKTPVKRSPVRVLVKGSDEDGKVGNEHTDLTKWHLTTDRGRQVWVFNEKQSAKDQKFYDRYFLGLDVSKDVPSSPPAKDATEATKKALEFYCALQMEDGHWGNDYGGPLFLLPGLIFTCYISKTPIPNPFKTEIIRYLTKMQREDGGWGLHIESPSTMFGTATNYVALRILGLPRSDYRMIKSRDWIHKKGGIVSLPHWGKFWMAALNLFNWKGVNPVPPELWVFPYFLPFHPGRWWCHCRVVYLPMAWIYGSRKTATFPVNDLIKELREELFVEEYDTIDWPSQMSNVAREDDYKGHSWLFKIAFGILQVYEALPIGPLREYSLKVTLDHIRYEDRETKGICIGPVNKALDMLVEFWAGGNQTPAFKQHQDRIFDYLWIAADGCKMQGYNGSQLWDTAFSLQAILATGMDPKMESVKKALIEGYKYIDLSQVKENNKNKDIYYRHISKGAWPFSTIDHGWPISDCTGEGFKCALQLPKSLDFLKDSAIPVSRLRDSVDVMLSYQNSDGGWPSYENQRGPAWLEMLNPADCFDGIMVDYSYVECTSSCIQALLRFLKYHQDYRAEEIKAAVRRGVKFFQIKQKPDGGWHGCWGVCYTYAAWFAAQAIADCKAAGIITSDSSENSTFERGLKFLLSKQHEDGSWGEDFKSCCERRWVDLPEGHVVNTAWALLALMRADKPNLEVISKGIKWLIKKQLPNGDWEQTTISGVFNYNCAISYSGYKNIFPIWALGEYISKFQK